MTVKAIEEFMRKAKEVARGYFPHLLLGNKKQSAMDILINMPFEADQDKADPEFMYCKLRLEDSLGAECLFHFTEDEFNDLATAINEVKAHPCGGTL